MVHRVPEFAVGITSESYRSPYQMELGASFGREKIQVTSNPSNPSIFLLQPSVHRRYLSVRGATLQLITAPRVRNFRLDLPESLEIFAQTYPGVLTQVVVVIEKLSHSARLIPEADGLYQSCFPNRGLDPTHLDEEAYKRIRPELAVQMPWVHVVETTSDMHLVDLASVIQEVRSGLIPSKQEWGASYFCSDSSWWVCGCPGRQAPSEPVQELSGGGEPRSGQVSE